MVAMEIWKQILREALEFWRLNCHVEIEERAIDDIGECREFSELTRVWGWRLGRVQGGELKSLRGLMGDVFRQKVSPSTRARNKSYRERLDVARVAMENLVLLRNVDAHTYEPIHDPGAVAALAGTLLMLVEHAGSVKGDLLEALGRLKEDARKALDLCVRQLDPGDEAVDSPLWASPAVVAPPSPPGAADSLIRIEQTIEAVRDVVMGLSDRSSPASSAGAPAAGVMAGGSPQVEEEEVAPVLAKVLSSLDRLVARSLTESDLKYLISIAKARQVDDGVVERRLSELSTSLAAVLDRIEPRAEQDDRHVVADRPAREGLQATLASLRDRILDEERLRSIVSDALAGIGTSGGPDPDWSEAEAAEEQSAHFDPLPDDERSVLTLRPVLTLQQAENRLVSLRNRIKAEENIEWFECALQRKFIRQMLDQRICDQLSWRRAGGPIRSWFEDKRNDRRVMERQLERYGDEIFGIMKSVDFGDEVPVGSRDSGSNARPPRQGSDPERPVVISVGGTGEI